MKNNNTQTTTEESFAITVIRERIQLIRTWILQTQMKYEHEYIAGLDATMLTVKGQQDLWGTRDHKRINQGMAKIGELQEAIDTLTFVHAD